MTPPPSPNFIVDFDQEKYDRAMMLRFHPSFNLEKGERGTNLQQ